MNRREFIAGSAIAAAGVVSGVSALAQGTLSWRGAPGNRGMGGGPGGARRSPIRKAISLGMISEGSSVMDKFNLAKECGIEGLEVTCPTSDENLKELIAARDATQVQIAGIMFGGNWSHNLTDYDPEKRKAAAGVITKALEQAAELGAPHVLVVPGVVNAGMNYEDAWKNSLEELVKLAPIAEKNRVKIGVENVWNSFLLSPVEMAYYLDQINSPWVGCLFDIGNIVNTGWPEHWIRTLNRRLVNLHIKGFDRKQADSKGKWAGFGVKMQDEGDFDWKPVAKALVDVNYRGWLIAEVSGGDKAVVQDISNRLEKMVELVRAESSGA
ncbi:MAG TPA: sugar phosphate isomerase/epimerase family protein [Verrucomicrobiota bacterium]|nr:sugar phosphate isomerase/epimerase family protein [Verrucomicrobiota bacterium]